MQGNQGNARTALASALDPDSCLVDGRSHRDRLAFVADFASLILYYDKTNQVAGDWRQFFMKEPAILMAAISKAAPESYYSTFAPGPAGAHRLMAVQRRPDPSDVAFVSQLCVLTTNMFSLLNLWYKCMDLAPNAYVLHGFLKSKIETTLADQLLAMVAWQQALSIITDGVIPAPDFALFKGFEPVWAMTHTARESADTQQFFAGRVQLQAIYNTVFSVFTQVVDYAAHAFRECEDRPTRFADTALLMTFSRLMDIEQQEINQLGRKHLDFYYQQVLQLSLRPAQADETYVCLTLSAKTDRFSLPAGTPFKAGVYADGSDVIFINEAPANLNGVQVNTLSTFNYSADSGWYLSDVADALGIPASDAIAQGVAVHPGFAIASPLLLLQGGARSITITLQLSGSDAAKAALSNEKTAYYLSTEKAWLHVLPTVPASVAEDGLVTLQFDLKASDPAIVAFKSAMEGVYSPWPMLKVIPGATDGFSQPPDLMALTITVAVDGFSPLVMANDNAVLPATGTTLPFGPLPKVGSRFYVGSNEYFAKPLTDLGLTIAWEGLPADFNAYYAAYNQYLTSLNQAPEFGNALFTVDWTVLKGGHWLALQGAASTEKAPVTLFQINPAPKQTAPTTSPVTPVLSSSSTFSFQVDNDTAVGLALAPIAPFRQASDGYICMQLVAPVDAFGHSLYAKVATSVTLQNAQALIKASTVKPEPWYSPLTAAITRRWTAIKGWVNGLKGTPHGGDAMTASPAQASSSAFLDMPNLPYTPAQQSVSVSYTATMTVDIQHATGATDYPLSIYHYGSFNNDLAYQTQPVDHAVGLATLSPVTANPALPLYPMVGDGWLYLTLSEAMTAPLSLLVGIRSDENLTVSSDDPLICQYGTSAGWRALQVLQDDTHNLSRSGVIRLQTDESEPPSSSSDSHLPAMPAGGFWLAIARSRNSGKITYLNTQVVKLRRSALTSVPVGTQPLIDANAIIATQHKIKQVAGVVQPFASFGGLPAEDQASFDRPNSFYRRVSTRLNHKDRAGSGNHYVELAHEAFSGLYYATVILGDGPPGSVCIGLVNGYANAQLPDAFLPQVSAANQRVIEDYIVRRASAMARVSVKNLRHQAVTVDAQLVISPQANSSAVIKALNQRLRVYLSPWIASDLPQMDIAKGVSRSALISVLKADANVLAVASLNIVLGLLEQGTDTTPAAADDLVVPERGAVLVTADWHRLKTITRAASQEVSHG